MLICDTNGNYWTRLSGFCWNSCISIFLHWICTVIGCSLYHTWLEINDSNICGTGIFSFVLLQVNGILYSYLHSLVVDVIVMYNVVEKFGIQFDLAGGF